MLGHAQYRAEQLQQIKPATQDPSRTKAKKFSRPSKGVASVAPSQQRNVLATSKNNVATCSATIAKDHSSFRCFGMF